MAAQCIEEFSWRSRAAAGPANPARSNVRSPAGRRTPVGSWSAEVLAAGGRPSTRWSRPAGAPASIDYSILEDAVERLPLALPED